MSAIEQLDGPLPYKVLCQPEQWHDWIVQTTRFMQAIGAWDYVKEDLNGEKGSLCVLPEPTQSPPLPDCVYEEAEDQDPLKKGKARARIAKADYQDAAYALWLPRQLQAIEYLWRYVAPYYQTLMAEEKTISGKIKALKSYLQPRPTYQRYGDRI